MPGMAPTSSFHVQILAYCKLVPWHDAHVPPLRLMLTSAALQILVGVIRLPQHGSDVVLSLNTPLFISERRFGLASMLSHMISVVTRQPLHEGALPGWASSMSGLPQRSTMVSGVMCDQVGLYALQCSGRAYGRRSQGGAAGSAVPVQGHHGEPANHRLWSVWGRQRRWHNCCLNSVIFCSHCAEAKSDSSQAAIKHGSRSCPRYITLQCLGFSVST